jgi:cold shock CspA family protein
MNPFAEDQELARHLAAQQPPPARPERPAETLRKNQAMEISGIVKHYDVVRQFGFICPLGVDPEDRSKQIYVHGAAVRRSGLTSLEKGQRVCRGGGP